VKNRFQNLPFKCNLQRYTAAAAVGGWIPLFTFTLFCSQNTKHGSIDDSQFDDSQIDDSQPIDDSQSMCE
jgi:hypothetical protein